MKQVFLNISILSCEHIVNHAAAGLVAQFLRLDCNGRGRGRRPCFPFRRPGNKYSCWYCSAPHSLSVIRRTGRVPPPRAGRRPAPTELPKIMFCARGSCFDLVRSRLLQRRLSEAETQLQVCEQACAQRPQGVAATTTRFGFYGALNGVQCLAVPMHGSHRRACGRGVRRAVSCFFFYFDSAVSGLRFYYRQQRRVRFALTNAALAARRIFSNVGHSTTVAPARLCFQCRQILFISAEPAVFKNKLYSIRQGNRASRINEYVMSSRTTKNHLTSTC